MSEYERNKGVLTKICSREDITESLAEKIVGGKLPDYYDSYAEAINDDPSCYGHAIIDGGLWQVHFGETDDDIQYCILRKNDDNTISFETYHYNGGAKWTELLEGKLEFKLNEVKE